MATLKNFEDLEIWKMSRQLTRLVYENFRTNKDFGFKDQIQRCSISIMNNIAEGFCRTTDREKLYFFNIAKGSAGELKSMLYIAEDLNYLSSETSQERRNTAQGLMNGIASLMKYLKNNNQK
jgi:four helix bundle protein